MTQSINNAEMWWSNTLFDLLWAAFHHSRDKAVCDRWTDIVPFPIPQVKPLPLLLLDRCRGRNRPTSLSSHWFGCLNSRGRRAGLWGLVFPAGQGKKIRVMQIWVMLSGLMLIVLQSKSYTQKLSKRQCPGMKARDGTYGGLIAKEAITLILATACHVYIFCYLFYLRVSDSDCKIIQRCQFWQSVELILN